MHIDILKIPEEDKKEIEKILCNFAEEKTDKDIFYNLCFAILAPQITYAVNRKMTGCLVTNNYYDRHISLQSLQDIIKSSRFYRNKSKHLESMKANFQNILKKIRSDIDSSSKRLFLVEHVDGIGMKAASHFLRNMGAKDLAIVDTHIMKFYGYTYRSPKNKKQYLEIENLFREDAKSANLTSAELDAWIWKVFSGTEWDAFDY